MTTRVKVDVWVYDDDHSVPVRTLGAHLDAGRGLYETRGDFIGLPQMVASLRELADHIEVQLNQPVRGTASVIDEQASAPGAPVVPAPVTENKVDKAWLGARLLHMQGWCERNVGPGPYYDGFTSAVKQIGDLIAVRRPEHTSVEQAEIVQMESDGTNKVYRIPPLNDGDKIEIKDAIAIDPFREATKDRIEQHRASISIIKDDSPPPEPTPGVTYSAGVGTPPNIYELLVRRCREGLLLIRDRGEGPMGIDDPNTPEWLVDKLLKDDVTLAWRHFALRLTLPAGRTAIVACDVCQTEHPITSGTETITCRCGRIIKLTWESVFRSARPTDAADWAKMLLARDKDHGPQVLERLIAYYEEHDGRADDFGRLWIVKDAQSALDGHAGG